MVSINFSDNPKVGRPTKNRIFKLRTLFWYYAIRKISKLNDAQLDLLFYPEKREYADRVRIFEEIRKTGASISTGAHKRRDFNLIDAVENVNELKGTKALYQCMLWTVLAENNPTLKTTKSNLLEIVSILELWKINYKKQETIDDDVEDVIRDMGLGSLLDDVADKVKINTNKSRDYTDVLNSICDNSEILYNITGINLISYVRHLNNLCLLILLYRYAMFTGNVHLLIACFELIQSNSSMLIFVTSWIDGEFKNELFHEIYQRTC